MNKHLVNYLEPFNSTFIYTLIVDVIGFGGIFALFYFFINYLQTKSLQLSQGLDPQALQKFLLTAPTEEVQAFSSQLQGFVWIFFIGTILIIILSLLLLSLTRSKIWYKLSHKKLNKKNFWKWNWLNLVLLVITLIYTLLALLIKGIINNILSFIRQELTLKMINEVMVVFFVLVLVIFIMLTYKSFSHKYKLWLSIGNAFKTIKLKWSHIWPRFLLALLTMVVLSLALSFIQSNILMNFSKVFFHITNFLVLLMFLSWIRLYVVVES